MDAPVTPARPDRRLADRYRLTELINVGGSGAVWAAVDELLGREVAVKDVLTSPYLSGPDRGPVHEHTVREAMAACCVDHPNVVHIYDLVEQDERPWIVMELVRAPSLAELIERAGPCAPRRAAVIGLQLLLALREIHARGVTHCDIKPSNVLIDGNRSVLTDFGIATIDGEAPPVRPDSIVGAPSYIAPERIRGAPATPASDLWSLGATLYTAVEGHPPHRGDDAHATLVAVATEEPEPTSRAGMLAPLLAALLRRNPARRPDAMEAERQLRRLITLAEEASDPGSAAVDLTVDEATAAYQPPAVTAVGPPPPLAERRPRRRSRALGFAAAVAGAATVLTGLALQPRHTVTQEVNQLPPPAAGGGSIPPVGAQDASPAAVPHGPGAWQSDATSAAGASAAVARRPAPDQGQRGAWIQNSAWIQQRDWIQHRGADPSPSRKSTPNVPGSPRQR